MKVLNFGSLNIDNVYQVQQIVRPGETISSLGMEVHRGGKGLNQSIALARAGMQTCHAGMVGSADGDFLLEALQEANVDISLIGRVEGKSGHCIIQVDAQGQNSIVLFGGSNHRITPQYIQQVFDTLKEGDVLLLQNEINAMDLILKEAASRGIFVILNPSPMNQQLLDLDLNQVDMFILNEVEAGDLTGQTTPEGMIDGLRARFPRAELVLTLGSDGSVYDGRYGRFYQEAYRVQAVDTTAAGDTFTGYFISEYFSGRDVAAALSLAAKASAIAVTRPGASPSIPLREEVLCFGASGNPES